MSTNNGSASKVAHGADGESFEDSFRQLQDVVRRLSEGSLTLQESLASFEEGMRLADRCTTMLEEAELRVKQASDRALMEGAASLASLVQRNGQDAGDVTLVEVEVERYEAVVIDGGDGHRESARPVPAIDELDPLFDEDD
jgi:exodeoxyribonuclease VII small subunit